MMRPVTARINQDIPPRALRVGSVSYLNAKPLIEGLEEDSHISLHLQVPASLLAGLESRELDVALLPIIDYQRLPNLRIIPSGGIGSDGETLTVRIFSRCPIEKMTTLACDIESHTSVALARILLAERYGIQPDFVDFAREQTQDTQAMLLIGDKVVCQEPAGIHYQMDLGAAWKSLTGLPFVFAIWTAAGGIDLGDLPERLEQAKHRGMRNLPAIISRFAIPRGWPEKLAIQYLSSNIKFDIGPEQLKAMRLFYQLAFKYNLISEPRDLEIYGFTPPNR